jgi:glycosyltransferase involved in cell wall biosynthesis
MKILMLTPYLPYPLVSGGQIRTYNLLKNLKNKHEITLFALIKEESERQYIKEIEPLCSKIRVFKRPTKPFTFTNILRTGFSFYPFVVIRNLVPEVVHAVQEELAGESYDLIHAETFYMMPNIPDTKIPIILVEQTIEYLGYQSYAHSSRHWYLKPFFDIDIVKIKYWEKHYWRSASRLITMSHNDRKFIQDEEPKITHIDVVANGVALDYFDAVKKTLPAEPTVLFVGTFNWLPNRQAVVYLVEKIWPLIKTALPAAKLRIVGFRPTPEIKHYGILPDVMVQGDVQDIRTAYATAHVLAAPVNWGKGTRYKILEAMATRTPIVATPLAVEGIAGISYGKHVLVGQTAEELAHLTVKALTDRKLQLNLADQSYQLVKDRYTWQAISADLDEVYQLLGHKL